MEFRNRGIAAGKHLAVSLGRDRGQRLGVHTLRKLVHLLAPGPEGVAIGRRALLGVTRERSLEGMAVPVAKARYDDPQRQLAVIGRDTGFDGFDAPVTDREPDVIRPAVLQQGLAGEELAHEPRSRLYIQVTS